MLSVILPVYNVEKYLERCLNSILGQTLADIEVVCVNDGSTDNSEEIIKEYLQKDSRIKLINQPNNGAASARNTGIEAARGDYILILDSDDFLEENALLYMYNRSKSLDLDILITYSYDLDNKTGEKTLPAYHLKKQYLPSKEVFNYKDIPDYIFNFSVGWAWDKLYKKSFIERYNLRFPNLQNTEDVYFVFMSLVLADRISVIGDALITHRVNNQTQLSQSRGYINWIMEHTVWQYRTAKNPMSQEKIRQKLIDEIYRIFDMKGKDEAFFYDKIAYKRMLEIFNK